VTTAVVCEAGAAASNTAVLVPPTTSPEEAALKSSPETVTAAPPTVSVVCPTTTVLAPCRVAVNVSPPAVTIAVCCAAACEAAGTAAKPTVLEPTTSPDDAALKTWPETVIAAPPAVSVELPKTTTVPEPCRAVVKVCPPAVTTAVCAATTVGLAGAAEKAIVLVPPTTIADVPTLPTWPLTVKLWPGVYVLPATTTCPLDATTAEIVELPTLKTALWVGVELAAAGALGSAGDAEVLGPALEGSAGLETGFVVGA